MDGGKGASERLDKISNERGDSINREDLLNFIRSNFQKVEFKKHRITPRYC